MGKIKIPCLHDILKANEIHKALYVFDKGFIRCDTGHAMYPKHSQDEPSAYAKSRGSVLDLERVVIPQRHDRAIAKIGEKGRVHTVNMLQWSPEHEQSLDFDYDAVFIAGDNLAYNFRNLFTFVNRGKSFFIEVDTTEIDQRGLEHGLKIAKQMGVSRMEYELFAINRAGNRNYEIPDEL